MDNELGRFNLRVNDIEIRSSTNTLEYAINPNTFVTMELIKWADERHYCTLGYFKYIESENCWEFRFVGDRPFKIPKEEIQTVWIMLQTAYDILQTKFVKSE